MHNIYVYVHRSLNSRNVWPSESEKLERSEFVVVVRCGGGNIGRETNWRSFPNWCRTFRTTTAIYAGSFPCTRGPRGGGINTCTVNDRTRVSSTLFFFPRYQFFTLYFFLSFLGFFLQMSTRTSTLIRYHCSRVGMNTRERPHIIYYII